MALSLDDRLLGERVENYCSSSEDEGVEDEGVEDDGERDAKRTGSHGPKFIPESELNNTGSGCRGVTNTGPKGVINDWRRFKQLEIENREAQDRERDTLIKKLSITCRSHLDDDKEKAKDDKFLEELEELDDLEEEFLREYRAKRIEEMRKAMENVPKFGRVIPVSKERFVEEIDKEKPQVTVLVHLYEDRNKACQCMHMCLETLAQEYITVKFCKLKASEAQLSHRFSVSGVPAVLIYKQGELIGNFVKLGDELGDDFHPSDLEGFLIENGFLPEKRVVSGIVQVTKQEDDSSGSDLD